MATKFKDMTPISGTLTIRKITTKGGEEATVVSVVGNIKDMQPDADGKVVLGGFVRKTNKDGESILKGSEIGKVYLKPSPVQDKGPEEVAF